MAKKIDQILETYDYKKFVVLQGNRKVKSNLQLENSIKENGVLVPLDVNEKLEILDGQHRLKIAEKYGISVPYRISAGLTIDDVIDLNNTIKAWNLEDFIHKFVVEGKEEYKRLEELMKKFKIVPLSSMVSAALGYLSLSGKSTIKVKNGTFQFLNYHHFKEFLKVYQDFILKIGIRSNQPLFFAFFNLYTTDKFDYVRLTNGVKNKNKEEITDVHNFDIILEFLLKSHNYGLRDNSNLIIKYELTKKGKPFITSQRDYTLVLDA